MLVVVTCIYNRRAPTMRCGQRKEYPEAHKPDNYECNAAMNNRDLLSNKVEGND